MLRFFLIQLICLLLSLELSYAQKLIRFSSIPYKPREELIVHYLPLLKLLESKLGVKFEFVYTESYDDFLNRFIKGEVDIIASGPLLYYMHVVKKGYIHAQPVAIFNEADGRSSYRCYLVVPEDGPKSIKELKGPFALPQKMSTCGYFSLSVILSKAGKSVDSFKYTFFNTHHEAFESMLRNEHKAVVVKDSVALQYLKGYPVKVIAQSPPWPAFVLAVNTKNLKSDFIERLSSTLFSLSPQELRTLVEGKYGFTPASNKDFEIFKNYEAHLPK
ncbi:MAG: phosphate/phosphite/phosphonate ABC transporter substrate-binding protein [Aquificaceae bacterium]|nr:phosphate/phosphite/phosphonate ABC transporter substrate-binding protein [Aquificaceae bacterium]